MTTEKDYSKYTVLAVDDVPLNLILVEKILKRYNFKVKKANGGQEALDMIAAEKPSLVLLDLMMPNVDGFDVLAELSKSEETSNIPVVILSALNSINYTFNTFASINLLLFEKQYQPCLKRIKKPSITVYGA